MGGLGEGSQLPLGSHAIQLLAFWFVLSTLYGSKNRDVEALLSYDSSPAVAS